MPPYTFYPPETVPEPYDVVWCFFPYNEALGEPAEKEHPVLIKQSFEGPNGPEVEAVYGTSSPDARGEQFFEVPPYAMAQCGLWKPTKFDVSRILRLPWCEEYFRPMDRGKPVIRHMDEEAIKEFQTHVAYYQKDRC